jgi:hypothetical protein
MRAVHLTAYGDPLEGLRYVDILEPEAPGPNQILIGVEFSPLTTWHADVIRRLAPRGIPIFVEKPMTPDAEEARRLAATLPGRLFVTDKWRYHPGIEALRDIAIWRDGAGHRPQHWRLACRCRRSVDPRAA